MVGGVSVFLGFGAPVAKSAALLSVLVHPCAARKIAFVLLAAGAGDPLKQLAVLPYPTMSTMFGSFGQVPVSAVEFLTSATFPDPAAIAIVPVASGVGKSVQLLTPDASWTK